MFIVMTVGDLAEAARLCGLPASVLLDRLLRAVEDDARVNVERAS